MNNNEIREQMLLRANAKTNTLKKSNEETVEVSTEESNTDKNIGATVADVGLNLTEGLVSSLEGIVDILAGGIGFVGGLFSDDFKDSVNDFTEHDFSSELFGRDNGQEKWLGIGNWREGITKKSMLDQDGIVNQVAQGVGGMLPTVALALATGGASLAGDLVFMAGAAGQAMESAQMEGADDDKALAYGLVSGAIEGATEMIGGRAIGEVTGMNSSWLGKKLLTTGVGQKIMGNTAGKIGYTIVSEGAEEVLSDILDPIAKSATGIQGWDETFSKENIAEVAKGLPKTFTVGGLTAVVMDGLQGTAANIKNSDNGGKHYTKIAEDIAQMNSVIEFNEMTKQSTSDKITQAKKDTTETNANKFIKTKLDSISTELQAMTEEQRNNALQNDFAPAIADFFNADGTVNEEVSKSIEEQISSGRSSNTSDTVFNATSENKYLASVLKDKDGNPANTFEVSTKELNAEQSKNASTIFKVVSNYAKNNGIKTSAERVVIFKANEKNADGTTKYNGFTNGKTLYINEDLLDNNGGWSNTLLHELSHGLEGTVTHSKFADSIFKDEKIRNKALDETAKGYVEKANATEAEHRNAVIKVEQILNKWENNETLTDNEKFIMTELSAKAFGNIGTENVIRELAKDKKGVWNKVRNLANDILNKKYTAENRAELAEAKRTARNLEKMFEMQSSEAEYKASKIGEQKYVSAEGKTGDKVIGDFLSKFEKKYGKSYVPVQMNVSTYSDKVILTKDGYKSGEEILKSALDDAGFDAIMSNRILSQINNAVSVINELRSTYKVLEDFASIKPSYRADGSLMLTCVVKNGEYEMNIDFTTICKKREALAKFLTEYQEQGGTFGTEGFSKNQQAFLENLLRKYGLESACSFCFVEARRKNVDTWGAKWQKLWYKALAEKGLTKVKSINSVEELKKIDVVNGITDSLDGNIRGIVDIVESDINSDAYRAYMETRESGKEDTYALMLKYIDDHMEDGRIFRISSQDLLNVRTITYLRATIPELYSIAIRSYGSNAPKMTLPASPYASDVFLADIFLDKNVKEKAFGMGGVRINSFSDFQITRVIDYIQFVADCQAKGLPIQTYTKELAMCEILGKCGIKGNLSLIPEVDAALSKDYAGLDKDGNYIMSRDSIDFKKATELIEKDGIKGDWGTCLVGIGKYQIIKALNDDRIKMIIPYHSSGMPKHLKIYFNHTLYTDYTAVQNTRHYGDGKWKKMKKDIFMDVFYQSYQKNNGDYLKAANDYIAYCRENEYLPRFFFGDLKIEKGETFQDAFDKALNNTDKQYIVTNPNYYKVLIDFTSDGGVDENGNRIFKKQEAVHLELPSSISFKSIVARECEALQTQIDIYEKNKGAMFRALQDAVNGKTFNLIEQKAIRDSMIAIDNGKYVVKDTVGFEKNTQFDIRGNGYDGYSMSNNARDAYDVGEKPWSKWTKTDLINAVSSINQSKIEIAKAMSVESLKKSILHQSSWHHTSKYYNKTNFYSVSEYGVNRLGYHTDFDLRMIDSNGSYAVYYSNENAHYDEKSNKWMYDGEPIPYEEPNDIRFDRTSVDNYTEKQYNDYGWVRANEVLSTEQYKVFTENFAKALKLKEYFNKSKSGEYMIPTYERYGEEEGIGNTIVFAKGTMANPIITKIIEIDLDNETEIDKWRRELYDSERRGIQQKDSDIFRRYYATDYEFGNEENSKRNTKYYFGNGLQRGRSGGETAKVKSIHFNEDGSREITYQDGTKEVQFDRTSADEDFNELHKDFLDEMYSNMGGVKDFDTQSIIKRGIPKINGKENLTVGEMKKQIADSTHSKVFSYASSLDLAKKLGASQLSLKSQEEIANSLWIALNDSTNVEDIKKFSADMSEYIVAKLITESKTENPDLQSANERIQYLENGIGRITFVSEDRSELTHILDKDGFRKLQGRWGYKGLSDSKGKKSPYPMDVFVTDIAREMQGMEYLEDMDPVEAFLEINKMYDEAKDIIGNKKVNTYDDIPDSVAPQMAKDIEGAIIQEFIKGGEKSKHAKQLEAYWEKQTSYNEQLANLTHSLANTADEIRAMVDKKFASDHNLKISATLINDNQFKDVVKQATMIFYRGQIVPKKVREQMYNVSKILSKNVLFNDYINELDALNNGAGERLVERLTDNLAIIDSFYEDEKLRNGKFDIIELKAYDDMMRIVKSFYANFDAIYEDGKRKNITEEAKKYIDIANEVKPVAINGINALTENYRKTILTPQAVVERWDGYNADGFLTHYIKRFRQDSWKQQINTERLMTDIDAFFKDKENKNYTKRLTEERIHINGINSPRVLVGEAIDIYLQATQDNGLQTLIGKNGAGFVYTMEDGRISTIPYRFDQPKKNDYSSISESGRQQLKDLYNSFSEQDKKFIKLVMSLYKEGGNLKGETDLALYGFTDVAGYGDAESKAKYYQLTRDNRVFARSDGDAQSKAKDVLNVGNLKINKKRSQNAHTVPLKATDVFSKLSEYVRQTTLYNAFGIDTNNYNRIKKKELAGMLGAKGNTVNMAYSRISDDVFTYMDKLMNDMQGVGNRKSDIGKALAWLRSNYAQAQLGLNVKVVLSQMASYPTALMHLDMDVLTKAIAEKRNYADMDKYSDAAKIRAYEKTVVKAQTLTDKVSKIGKVTGAGIQASDRLTIGTLWNACQLQIEKDSGLKVGTEENKVKAGELLNQVITDTQPTYQAIDRSALQRSDNEVLKSIAMFTSVPLKQASMLISSIGKYRYIKSSLKNGKTIFTEADLKKARKQMTRNIVAVTAANVMYAMVCQGVKLLLDQDDEEDNDGKNSLEQMISQFVDTSFGMFPFVKEIESFFVHGYEVSEISTSSMNNVLSDIRNTYALGEKVVSGTATSQDVAKTVRQTIYDAGMVFGLPIRNTYNLAYGLTKRVSDTAAYEINSIFYEPKSSDITTAINKNDDRLARASLSGVMLTKGFDVSDEQASILLNGYKNGGNLPSGVPTKITVDGVEQELTKKERQIFESVYSKASTEVDKCIDKGLFKSLKTDEQVKVLNTIYKYYYDLAKMEALGLDASKLSLMGQAFNIGTFAKVITVCGTFTGDNRKEQITKYINSQNLTAAQKYMLMGYLGYKNTKGKAKVESYIKTLDLTKAEKEKLLGYSGY